MPKEVGGLRRAGGVRPDAATGWPMEGSGEPTARRLRRTTPVLANSTKDIPRTRHGASARGTTHFAQTHADAGEIGALTCLVPRLLLLDGHASCNLRVRMCGAQSVVSRGQCDIFVTYCQGEDAFVCDLHIQ